MSQVTRALQLLLQAIPTDVGPGQTDDRQLELVYASDVADPRGLAMSQREPSDQESP